MIKAGQRYMVTREDKSTVRKFAVVVNWIEDRGEYWYVGYTPDDFRICRWGCCKVKKQGKYERINYSFSAI